MTAFGPKTKSRKLVVMSALEGIADKNCSRQRRTTFRAHGGHRTDGMRTDVMEYALLWFDVCLPNAPCPLFSVVGDKLSELSGRSCGYYHSPKIDEPRLDGGVGDCQIDFHVESINDRNGRIFRRTKAE